jgi:hypothetical protein
MVTIRHQPINEIIIHELVKVNSIEDFLSIKTNNVPLGSSAPPARWADGILYEPQGFPPTPEIIKDQIEGKIHFAAIEYTEMPQYKQYLKNSTNNVLLPIIDMSHNEATKQIAQWLKGQIISK